jgi:shikimate dehydrogenase
METYGLIGQSLSHSFSAEYFNQKFITEKIKAQYLNFPLKTIADFNQLLKEHPNLRGINVTIPYKTAIIPFLLQLDDEAKCINAVNCISFNAQQELIGHNTDYIGFWRSIAPVIQHRKNQKALILGNGGAAKAVKYAFDINNIEYTIVNRTQSSTSIQYNQLNEALIHEHQIIVNTTPLGTYPNIEETPAIPFEFITDQHILYDLIYNPSTSSFLKKGLEKNAVVKNGYEMLLLQAEAAWEIWNKK